ncbi:PREDICTED: protein indeterminate-domain 16-like, partial [Camelina sativa]|uniref:Protein indeterminate-domain 16-like n=1 Tax=Camelina sativa TaxID=90675 RepID=A0ABM0YIV9_CAMSA
HALGDLVGIKKHFRRKHSVHKQWVCERCSKGYAVQSDYKAHLKTCGSRGHSCDCGRVFSRVESFIEHQDTCTIRHSPPTNHRPLQQHTDGTVAPSRTTSTTSFGPLLHGLPLLRPPPPSYQHSQALAYPFNALSAAPFESLELQLSIGMARTSAQAKSTEKGETSLTKERPNEEARMADKMRQEAKRQIEIAETDFEKAKRIRKEAKAELEKAQIVREEAIKRINATMMEITCHSCKHLFQLI